MKRGERLEYDIRLEYMVSMGVIALSVVLFLITVDAVWKDSAAYHHFAVASVMIELVFSMLTASTYITLIKGGYPRRMFVKFFLWMLALVTLGMMGDIFAWGIGMEGYVWHRAAVYIGSFLRDSVGFPLIVVYSIYLLSYINEDASQIKRYAWLVSGLCVDGMLLVLIDRITSRSPVNTWHLWDHPWLYFFFLTVPMVVSVGIIFYFRKHLTNVEVISFCGYELLVLAAVVVDILLVDVTLAYAMAAFALIRIYISVQIEYERKQEEQLLRQRIAIMLSQIQPHFLYNVLTGIRALCRLDPQKAETALLDFTSYLRGNLSSLKQEGCIPFSNELQHIRHYVELEKMRYGDDLNVIFCTPVTEFEIPSLTLEPIVENAVRHGVMQRETGGTVTIVTIEEIGRYLITVTDNGVGFDVGTLDGPGGDHVGLRNVRERLAAICGGELDIRSDPGAGTVAMLSIPKQGGKGI